MSLQVFAAIQGFVFLGIALGIKNTTNELAALKKRVERLDRIEKERAHA